MSYILNIETTTKNCSVAIAKDGKLLTLEEINDGNYAHSEFLNPLIDSVLKRSNLNFKDLDAIAVSKGPGSYTGLRIGVSTAKGLCFAMDLPLIAVDTLSVLSKSISVTSGYIIPMLDARRMEIYSAVFNAKNEIILPTNAFIIEESTFDKWLSTGEVHFVGDAVDKCATAIHHPNAVFHKNTFPSAKDMVELSNVAFQNKNFEDLAYFEPYYLKDFIITKKV